MKKIMFFMCCVFTNLFVFSQIMPLKTLPLIWLKADNAGINNNAWKDNSGNNLDAFTLNNQFKNDSLLFNFNKSFHFDSLSQAFTINYLPKHTENLTIITVYKAINEQQENGLWFIKIDSTTNVKLTTKRIGSLKSTVKYSDTTDTKPIINSLTQGWKKIQVDSLNSKMLLCGTDSLPFSGKMAEFLLFDKSLSKFDLKKVQSYLAIKYGITLFQSDYLNSKDSIIWNYKQYKEFSYDIAGIGKDSLFTLIQKQSAAIGGDDILTIGANHIYSSNIQNNSQLNNYNFLVWGNNGKKLETISNDSIETTTINQLPDKKWMMQVTGDAASSISTQLIFDASGVDSLGKCVLLINRDATANFTMDNTEIFTADSTDANKKVYFSEIHWDSDHSGKDVFTFLLGNRLTLLAKTINASSAGSNNGVINLEVVAGKSPFNYSLLADSTQHFTFWNSSDSLQSVYNLAPGKYLVKVTDIKGSTDAKWVRIGLGTANNDFAFAPSSHHNGNNPISNPTENKFEIYPNPCKGDYAIYAQVFESIDITVRVRDIAGRLIDENTVSGQGQFIINGKLKDKGNYLIEIESKKEKKSFKLIVE